MIGLIPVEAARAAASFKKWGCVKQLRKLHARLKGLAAELYQDGAFVARLLIRDLVLQGADGWTSPPSC
jgi:hypothetical protein